MTVQRAYTQRAKSLEALEMIVRPILEGHARAHGFMVSGRIKTLTSTIDKLEAGWTKKFSDIDDMLAFSIVIDELSQEKLVDEFISEKFDVVRRKAGKIIQDERAFDFDSTRYVLKIKTFTGEEPELASMSFEVQVRTLLQHAWSKITHPHVYKAGAFDPKLARLAAELMAQIEGIDRTFSRFSAAATGVKSVVRKDIAQSTSILEVIDRLIADDVIPSEMRPANGRRLADSVRTSIQNPDKNLRAALNAIDEFFRAEVSIPRSLSLMQLCTVALLKAELLENSKGKSGRWYHVSQEMVSLYPSSVTISNKIAISE